MKRRKKITILLLAAVLSLACSMTLLAAVPLPSISSGRPIKCYTLKSSGRIYAYTASNLRNKTGGYIDCATDECSILRIRGNAVQVRYPVGDSTRTAWFARTEFSNYNLTNGAAERWTQDQRVTTYQRADGRTSYGSISAGDTCYKLSVSGNYEQVIYPVSGGYKMGWIMKNDKDGHESDLGDARPIADGMYKVVSAVDNNYVWDIDDASSANGANLQLYKDNNTNAQKFRFTYDRDGYYTIKNANSGKAVDCASGASANGTNIQQYTSNNSDAQRWKLKSVGNGYFSFMCKCNGKMADVSGGKAANRTNIQIYQSNGSAAQKFKLVKTTLEQENLGEDLITVFGQKDERWKNVSYGKGPGGKKATLSSSGCGILSYVNAVYYMTGNFIQPSELAKWSVDNGYRINGQGTAMGLYKAFADECGKAYGFQYSGSKKKVRDVRSHLQNGGTAIIHVDGHLMALVAYNGNNGKYLILDSYAHKNSGRGTGKRSDGAGYRWLKESEFKGRLTVSEIRLLSKI